MRKEIIITDSCKFASRYKKWYHLRWRYIGVIDSCVGDKSLRHDFVLRDTKDECVDNTKMFFPVIKTINND